MKLQVHSLVFAFAFTAAAVAQAATTPGYVQQQQEQEQQQQQQQEDPLPPWLQPTQPPAQQTEGPAQTTQGSAQQTQGYAQTTQGSAQQTQGYAQTTQGSAQTTQGSAQTTQGSAQITQGYAQTTQGYAQTTQGSAQTTQGYAHTTQGSGSAQTTQGQAQQSEGGATLPSSFFQTTTASSDTTQGSAQTTQGSAQTTQGSGSAQTTQSQAQESEGGATFPFTFFPTTTTTTASPSASSSNTTTGDDQQQEQQTLPPGTGTQTTDCRGLLNASDCINAAYQDMLTSLFFFVFNQNVDILVNDMCLKYEKHRQCVKGALESCNGYERVAYDVVIAAFDYICSPSGRNTVREAWPCLGDAAVGHDLRQCTQSIAATVRNSTGGFSPCLLASSYVGCVSGSFHNRCNAPSGEAIQELLSNTLTPFSSFFQCPAFVTTPPPTTTTPPPTTTTTTTTTTPPPTTTTTTTAAPTTTTSTPTTTTTTTTTQRPAFIGCYDCNTGINGFWPNRNCPVDGRIHEPVVTKTPCASSCFARVTRSGVFRGCSSGHAYTFNYSIPTSGCRPVRNGAHTDYWCFCNGEACNAMDMSPFVYGPGSGSRPFPGGSMPLPS